MDERSLTQWANGRFRTVKRPGWFDEAVGRRLRDPQYQDRADQYFGFNDEVAKTRVYELREGPGAGTAGIDLYANRVERQVWVPDEADLLDVVTTRGVAWLEVTRWDIHDTNRDVHVLRNAFVSFARHGSSQKIGLNDGKHYDDDLA
ncbi:hypothetical protein [Muricoccus radiodurans]|uniref:hypothetical protein n=1 Tax=Muricoccus radiodurans TaxID=2231721 RepID=UPI003CED9AFC